jgi:hypothetical protein
MVANPKNRQHRCHAIDPATIGPALMAVLMMTLLAAHAMEMATFHEPAKSGIIIDFAQNANLVPTISAF